MSGFVGDAGGVLSTKDRRLVPNYQAIRRQMDRISERYSATVYPGGYVSDYWPGNGSMGGDRAVDVVSNPLYGHELSQG